MKILIETNDFHWTEIANEGQVQLEVNGRKLNITYTEDGTFVVRSLDNAMTIYPRAANTIHIDVSLPHR